MRETFLNKIQSLDVYRSMFENAIEGIFQTTTSGQYLNANPALAKMYGYDSAQELMERVTCIDRQLYVDQSRRKAFVQAMEANGVVRGFEAEVYRKDGSIIWISENARAVQGTNGLIDYYEGMVEDITERKQAEEYGVRSLALLRATLDSTQNGILTIGLDRKILSFNETFVRMWRIPADILTGSDDNRAIQYVLDQLQSPEKFLAKVHYLYDHPLEESFDVLDFKDRRVFERFSRPMLVEGRPLGRVWSFRDITERRRAHEKIAEQAALLDQTQDAIVVRTLHGEILFWNKGAERIYGCTSKEVLGRHIGQLIYADPRKFESVNELLLNQAEWSGELQQFTKDRRLLTVEGRCTLLRDKDGHPKSVLEINTDVTEKKRIEAQFLRAQRMESIGTLAGGIAHDLNNILAPIMMAIDTLKLTVTDPKSISILESIGRSSKRGADIVRQVLSFARGMEGERIEVRPDNLVNDTESIIKDTFPKNIHRKLSIPRSPWKILGDPTQLHQVLLNLCLNARDAMPQGGTLTIKVENMVLKEPCTAIHLQAKPGRYVIINITDTGMGIPAAILDKIFEPFFTTKEVGKGTGIGLSTVLAIVKSHGGFVNVYSEPGLGTTFKVYFPAMESSSEEQKDSDAPALLPKGKGETILIVDDEAAILDVTSQTLESFGYRILTANNGKEAVAIYTQHQNQIAAVVTDMAMPIMDGPATINALRKLNPAVKIIVVSGSASSAPGIKYFLSKPYRAITLLKTLQKLLNE